jgi:hypothetical protein
MTRAKRELEALEEYKLDGRKRRVTLDMTEEQAKDVNDYAKYVKFGASDVSLYVYVCVFVCMCICVFVCMCVDMT